MSFKPPVPPRLLAVLVGVCAFAAAAQTPSVPRHYVTDRARVLRPADLARLNERLAAFERETSCQVIVYVDRRLPPGRTLEQFSAQALRDWRVGQAGVGNGAGLFVFVDSRVMRLEVGPGLRPVLTDVRARYVTANLRHYFRAGDYAGGLSQGVEMILSLAGESGHVGSGRTASEAASPAPTIPRPRPRPDVAPAASGAEQAGLALLFLGVLLALVGVAVFGATRARRRSLGLGLGRGDEKHEEPRGSELDTPDPAGHEEAAHLLGQADLFASTEERAPQPEPPAVPSQSTFSGGGWSGGGGSIGGSSDSW